MSGKLKEYWISSKSLNSLTDCVCIVRYLRKLYELEDFCLNSLTDCVCIVSENENEHKNLSDIVLIALRTVYV